MRSHASKSSNGYVHTIVTKCSVCGRDKLFIAGSKSKRKAKALVEAAVNVECRWCLMCKKGA
jgi:hypothetical protein